MELLDEVRDALERFGRDRSAPILVAVSGGVDSMVLLHALHRIGQACVVMHVDHGLRGSEGRQDGELVEATCGSMGVPFTSGHVPSTVFNAPGEGSVQMRARDSRYALLKEQARKLAIRSIALAHQADDQVETLLLHLIRGAGVRGWRGVPPRSGPFIRPLLRVRRSKIEAYAREHGVAFREDPSNVSSRYLRNRIRHEVLPLLEMIRPGAVQGILHSLDVLHPVIDHWGSLVDAATSSTPPGELPFELLEGELPSLPMLQHVLRPCGFHPDVIQAIDRAVRQRRTGASFLSDSHTVWVEREVLLIRKTAAAEQPVPVSIHADLVVPENLPIRLFREQAPFVFPRSGASVVWLDPSALTFPLILRGWSLGDRMQPSGMDGSKLVSDLLIDAKVPRPDKASYPVLCSSGRIVWLPGIRLAKGVSAKPGMDNAIRAEYHALHAERIADPLSSAS